MFLLWTCNQLLNCTFRGCSPPKKQYELFFVLEPYQYNHHSNYLSIRHWGTLKLCLKIKEYPPKTWWCWNHSFTAAVLNWMTRKYSKNAILSWSALNPIKIYSVGLIPRTAFLGLCWKWHLNYFESLILSIFPKSMVWQDLTETDSYCSRLS